MNDAIISFSPVLLRWFEAYGRDLPWRHTRDPYLIWLSEIILQQTRVEQGRDYWLRFVHRWPTVELLAAATEDEVLREWQGLGYYSRARNLLAAARQVVEAGGFPQTVAGLQGLRGVGAYTAAAIASLAFDVPAAVVDGNVYRVLARYLGIDTPIDSTEGHRLFALLAQELLPPDRAADYNQAIMDFGAIQCTPANPACLVCPLAESCVALREGRVGELPVKTGRTKVQERHLQYIYIRYSNRVLFRRRGAGDFWQGLWEPVELSRLSLSEAEQQRLLSSSIQLASGVRHILSHRRLLCDFYLLDTKKQPTFLPAEYEWVDEGELDKLAKPRLVEIMLEQVVRFRLSPCPQ